MSGKSRHREVVRLLKEGDYQKNNDIITILDGDDVADFAIENDDIETLSYVTLSHYAKIYPDGLMNALRNNSGRASRYIIFKQTSR